MNTALSLRSGAEEQSSQTINQQPMEDIMNTILKTTTAFVLVIGFFGSSPAAFATNTREALKMCSKNPKCTMRDVGSGFIVLTVPGAGGTVMCPMINGPCQVRTSVDHSFDSNQGNNNGRDNGLSGNSDGGGQVGGPAK